MEAIAVQSVTGAVLLPLLLRHRIVPRIGYPFLTIPFIVWC